MHIAFKFKFAFLLLPEQLPLLPLRIDLLFLLQEYLLLPQLKVFVYLLQRELIFLLKLSLLLLHYALVLGLLLGWLNGKVGILGWSKCCSIIISNKRIVKSISYIIVIDLLMLLLLLIAVALHQLLLLLNLLLHLQLLLHLLLLHSFNFLLLLLLIEFSIVVVHGVLNLDDTILRIEVLHCALFVLNHTPWMGNRGC